MDSDWLQGKRRNYALKVFSVLILKLKRNNIYLNVNNKIIIKSEYIRL